MPFMLHLPLSLSEEDCGKVLLRFLCKAEACTSSNNWSLCRAIKLASLSSLSWYIPPATSQWIREWISIKRRLIFWHHRIKKWLPYSHILLVRSLFRLNSHQRPCNVHVSTRKFEFTVTWLTIIFARECSSCPFGHLVLYWIKWEMSWGTELWVSNTWYNHIFVLTHYWAPNIDATF